MINPSVTVSFLLLQKGTAAGATPGEAREGPANVVATDGYDVAHLRQLLRGHHTLLHHQPSRSPTDPAHGPHLGALRRLAPL